jgi:transposase InsO family protein
MSVFSVKELMCHLKISQQAITKKLKDAPYFKKDSGNTKKVKYYEFRDLPLRYQESLKSINIEESVEVDEESVEDSLSANFTNKYLRATKNKQLEAVLRVRLVEAYLKRDDNRNINEWIVYIKDSFIEFDELGEIKEHNIYKWLKKYSEAKAKGMNVIEALLDSRGSSKRGFTKLTDEQKETAIRYFLKSSRPKIKAVYLNMCHTFGGTLPSYGVVNNFYKQWKLENPQLSLFAQSPDNWKNSYLAAFGDMSAGAKYKNHIWELDSTPADIICSDGKRYTVLGAVDVFSRRVSFFVASSSSSFSISRLLRESVVKFGIPENVVIDNGRDYRSNHFESCCVNLGINIQVVPPYSGEMKPHIERVFRTLSGELFEEMPGFIGHSVEQRRELGSRKSFGEKIEAKRKWREQRRVISSKSREAFCDAWKMKKENIGLDLEITLSAEELQFWINSWVEKLYETRVHGG